MSRKRGPSRTELEQRRSTTLANVKPEPLDTRLGVLGYAECSHDGLVSTFIVPRAKPTSDPLHRATAAWWRFDWCRKCGALRTWTGPAESDAGEWVWPELSERWRK